MVWGGYLTGGLTKGYQGCGEGDTRFPKRVRLYLVQIGSNCYLIGTSQGSVNLIKELSSEAIEEARDECILSNDSTEKISFPELFKNFKRDKK